MDVLVKKPGIQYVQKKSYKKALSAEIMVTLFVMGSIFKFLGFIVDNIKLKKRNLNLPPLAYRV